MNVDITMAASTNTHLVPSYRGLKVPYSIQDSIFLTGMTIKKRLMMTLKLQ